jgi:hypothetical protein
MRQSLPEIFLIIYTGFTVLPFLIIYTGSSKNRFYLIINRAYSIPLLPTCPPTCPQHRIAVILHGFQVENIFNPILVSGAGTIPIGQATITV